jgi:hypothetical protein
MRIVEVKTKTRALRSTWTTEMVNDLSVYHNLDAEKELAQLLLNQIHKKRISMRKKSINKIFNNIL